jgi:hypothetical protein
MARVGYIEARDRCGAAKENLAFRAAMLVEQESKPSDVPAYQEQELARRRRALAEAKIESDEAERAFDPFRRPSRTPRVRYDYLLQAHVSVGEELNQHIREDRAKGISLAEIFRRALMEHYKCDL